MALNKFLRNFFKNTKAATAIEYGLIAGLLSIVIVVSVTDVGGSVTEMYTFIGDEIAKVLE